ncbi:MAG: hypothetical protein KJZ69_18715 [Phycisphaerales bacterium]|nr:hypothetical protein [Phycisphaerales bacterium]
MNERSIHQRGRARGSEDDAARDRRPTLQWPVIDPLWDLPALRVQNACEENFPNNTPQFSPLKEYYESAALSYQITNFDPHGNGCGSCPGN